MCKKSPESNPAGVHLQVETQEARKIEQSVVKMSLDMVCDAVLLLDGNLQIVDHSQRLQPCG